ncbi:AbrB family transcriptional regulator [Virgibacillus dakarensis]|uniref:Aminopeptidase n=1 Tax=Lentibacillus populi TaxID=1827502 RepID=A0A9W5U2K6_9BACI|nr:MULTISPECIES: AbrB family transcriptional regulator [Bacillaceae]MBT2217368.1 AbrB family transcriptional regulator [Virgibacillus dakarensis]MTW87384.1 AbrB family transcriptional regulator [Virgibacillus dakarensis]GGB60311.1 aminopeptidase [Lentibacillus populi]
MKANAPHLFTQFILTLITAVIGGVLFTLLHVPVPWLLGPMVAVVIGTNVMNRVYVWPSSIRNTGMIIVGYTIGLSMTSTALKQMALQLPTMLLMTLLLMLLCSGIAFVISRFSGSDYSTSLLSSIPGGLTQVIMLAEETKGINLAVVTVTQVIRLMIIVIMMPLLVMIPIFQQGEATVNAPVSATVPANWAGLFPNIIIFALVCIVFALVGSKINFPTAFLLGPLIGTTLLQLSGVEGPKLPPIVVDAAQLMIGTHVGSMLNINQLQNKMRTIGLAIASGVMLVIGGVILSMVLTKLYPISNATSLLSMAPGGMDQMGIIAHEIHADLSIVSGYQLFRTLFIYFAIPPAVKLMFKIMNRRRTGQRKYSH